MATIVAKPGDLTSILVARIQSRLRKFQPDDPKLREVVLRIGQTLEAQTKLNIRSQGLIDTGRLFNSIRYEYFKITGGVGVDVGSFGVPYAAVHEFGFDGIVSVSAHKRAIAQAFGNPIEPKLIDIRQHRRHMRVRARPYLRPALLKNKDKFVDMFRTYIREGLASGK